MQEAYGCKVGLKSPAHITVVPPFWMDAAKEAELKEDTRSVAGSVSPLIVYTNNFSTFGLRTLFVAVKENPFLNALKESADQYFSNKAYKLKKDLRPFHPHITIATRDLRKKDFAEAWMQVKDKRFEESFEAAGLSLLKHNGNKWEVINTAMFAV